MDDMLRFTVSIKAERLSASTVLQRIGTYSRENRLYLAFSRTG
jgi:TnpA family transposase